MTAVKLLVALFILTVFPGRKFVGAQVVHHVLSSDRASDTSTDIGPWSSGRVFRVGDSLLFKYYLPQDIIVELASMEEYYSCDLTNPIKMYTQQLTQVPLEKEGVRYFASGSFEKCQKGLKLPVHVRPRELPATGPSPSSATHLYGLLAITLLSFFTYAFYLI
ncbi:mavicyanin-like [Rutidosis leptorrhynchoides]|uniref:mavicyanin-like n=1 Tax=Rutidosis leptorrhynchoides TaxID=125765 RepID=UPI003A9968D4